MLNIEKLYFNHSSADFRRSGREDVLKGVSCKIPGGRMTTVLGPNGSGKTTLFKCISGLWHPYEGAIFHGGRDITKLSAALRAGLIAVVPQEHDPPFPYKVADIVLMGRASHVALFSAPSQSDVQAADCAMEQIGISHLRHRPYTKISGGERQLVLTARALAQETPLLILDEPTSHLDFRNSLLILSKVRDIVRQNSLTVLMTLHDPNLAMQFSDHVVMIVEGTVLAQGLPAEVLTPENIRLMYGLDVSVIRHNGINLICPEAAL
ncbi:MAG TPA: ABC transporter ATP-binding protein [Smithellaceae bacterium]|nr:ABC transporter ATP-binding protein [Smithellaceae bacterium]